MKLLEQSKIQKQVVYKGLKLTVPIATQFLAADQDGELYSYFRRPLLGPGSFGTGGKQDEAYLRVGRVSFEAGESWKDSCERVLNI